jgi:hypothetical protein
MEQSLAASQNAEPADRHRDNSFGVQSLADTLEAAFGSESHAGAGKGYSSHGSPKTTKKDPGSSKTSSPRLLRKKTSSNNVSHPPTPLDVDSPSLAPPSAMPSTPRSLSLQSLKLSDDEAALEETGSQTVASSGTEEGGTVLDESSSFPQLVMPSIQMPSRRPFTAKGKAMGKLKVLVAGDAGMFAPSSSTRNGMSLTVD